MKKILGLMTLLALTSCASKRDFEKHHVAVAEELRQINSKNETFRKDVIDQVKYDLREELKAEIVKEGKDSLVLEMKDAVYVESKKDLDQYRAVISEILAEKFSEQETIIKEEISKALMEGPFIPMLEQKMVEGLSDQQQELFESKRKILIDDVVDRVLNEIVGKEIGIGKQGSDFLK